LFKIKFIYISGTYRTNNTFSIGLGIGENLEILGEKLEDFFDSW